MKKLVVTAVFILAVYTGTAQTQAFKDDVKRVVRITQDTEFEMASAKEQMLPMIAADKQEAFLKEFENLMATMNAAVEKFYFANYTHDEVKQMLKYYDSPIGKKVTGNASKLNMEIGATAEEVGNKLNEMMMRYMQ